MSSLFTPCVLGDLTLPNRIVMAPMTRSRAPSTIPDELTALYYRQRASAGLLITEAAQVSTEGRGYLYTPGVHSDAQVAGWRGVVEAVHAAGGRIFLQLWHVGRISHVSLQDNGAAPVSSMDRVAKATVFACDAQGVAGPIPVSPPRALSTEEVGRVTQDFVRAAENAMRAGFDGIEIHGANGYLFEQFINGGLNTRSDRYGGSITNRLRFTLETVDAVAKAIGNRRLGIRLAPYGRLFDMHAFDDEEQTWLEMARELASRNLAYVHLSDQGKMGGEAIPATFMKKFRTAYPGTLILAGGYNKQRALAALDSGSADLIAFGRPFIANPDFVERLQNDWPLARFNPAKLYGGGREGYVDYLRYEETPT